MVILFGPGVSVRCTDISILGDNVLEASEVFNVELTTSDPQVALDPDSASVTILSNNSEFVEACRDVAIYHH